MRGPATGGKEEIVKKRVALRVCAYDSGERDKKRRFEIRTLPLHPFSPEDALRAFMEVDPEKVKKEGRKEKKQQKARRND